MHTSERSNRFVVYRGEEEFEWLEFELDWSAPRGTNQEVQRWISAAAAEAAAAENNREMRREREGGETNINNKEEKK